MDNATFADLFQNDAVSQKKLQPGDQVRATIIAVRQDTVFLDIGGKSEGLLNAAELKNAEGELTARPGDTLTAFFLSAQNGSMLFTTRLGSGRTTPRELEEAWQAGIPVEGRVVAEVKGGFAVMVSGLRSFCPYSQMDLRRVEDPADYLDKSFLFKIMELGQKNNLILSARALLEEQREQERALLKERLHEGMVVSGTVTSLRDFGAFVDIGGVDGLIPLSELAWGTTDRAEDVLSRGQKVEVLIKGLDWEKNRIALSLKETTPNPWDAVPEKYPVGSIHQGRISRLTNFGAFVTLEPGIDGLVHISKLGKGRRIHHPREVVEAGQELTVKIESFDAGQKRLSLSPEDYIPQEGLAVEREEIQLPPAASPATSLGTLGDLLKKAQGKKAGKR